MLVYLKHLQVKHRINVAHKLDGHPKQREDPLRIMQQQIQSNKQRMKTVGGNKYKRLNCCKLLHLLTSRIEN